MLLQRDVRILRRIALLGADAPRWRAEEKAAAAAALLMC
jgi:hypothetical protein